MFDFGDSHNLMSKDITEKLGLDITRKYHELYSFDSCRIRCIGLIKDLVVSLDQIPAKNVLMDVVVVDIPPRFGMLLSRSWGAKINGTLHLDFSYATIPVFGQLRKLYREKKMKYVKVYDKDIIQHTIPIKPNQKLFRQKLRKINPKLLPSIEKEVNRLFKASIIVPIRFSDWISNLVLVQKKTREIILCIDFRNLNKVSLKDNYPLPKMDHILQRVVGASRMSLLDGYSTYNQILVHEGD
eukprot:PITA_34680